jgi:hypothetical protein
MIALCIAPLVLIFIAAKFFGLNSNYLFFGAMMICLVSHLLMAKSMTSEKKECH